MAGIDIRTVGSGNIGATNVTRALGKPYGYAVFLADFSKGLAAVLLSRIAGHQFGAERYYEMAEIVAAVCCVLGNAFPVWLRFRGGKGVATSAGVVFALMPLAAVVVTLVWLATFQITHYISVASMIGALALPLAVLLLLRLGQMTEPLFLYVSLGLAAVVILRHRSNLARLVQGTEQRFRRNRGD